MANQKLELQLRGLFTAPNQLSGVPAGSLSIADNVVINSKSLIESRRGQTQYGDPLNIGTEQINKLFNYSSSLVVNYDSKMAYDSGSGVWIDYPGTYEPPASDTKMRSLEALRNFYFTTSEGIYKIDSLSGTPKRSGVVRALGGTASLVTGAFLENDTAVAYRIVWGYTDANNNLLLGAPSQRLVISNSSGSAKDVSLTFIIPDTVTTSYFYQIYRSNATATAADEPDDELQLVLQANPTSGQITAKQFTVTDSTPYSLMRATIYTAPSQQGIANSNNPPPFAIDMDVFKTCAFYANTKQKQTLQLAIISVESPSLGYYIDATVDTTSASDTLTNIASTSDLRVGMRIVGTGVPANTTIAEILSGTSVRMSDDASATGTVSIEFQDRFSLGGVDYFAGSSSDVATNQFLVDVSGTPAQNIDNTAQNLIQIINTSTSNTTLYGYYVSGLEDLPGQMLFEERSVGGSSFFATSTIGNSFSPVLPTSGSTIISDNEVRQNRVYISKPSQVEAVPVYRYFDIGSANFPISRTVALRDGIFFFKTDGIYRISGETFESFVVTLVDNTVILKVPESAVAFNNQVFCFTTQGVCAVTDSGVRLISVPIENTLLELSSEQYTNFATASFGVAYESARLYIFFTITETDDVFANQAYVYNYLTDSWTRWVMDRTCGVVNTSVNKLFMAHPDSGQVLIERKTFTNEDYADEQYSVIIDSVDSVTQVTLTDASVVEAGMTLVQGFRRAYIVSVDGDALTIDETAGLEVGAATVYTPIQNKIQWVPIDCDNPGILKQFSEISLFFKNAAFREIEAGFSSNVSTGTTLIPVENIGLGGWGSFPWGEQPWGGTLGGQVSLRTYVPREKQRASWISLTLRTEQAFTGFSLQGVSLMFNPMSSRQR